MQLHAAGFQLIGEGRKLCGLRLDLLPALKGRPRTDNIVVSEHLVVRDYLVEMIAEIGQSMMHTDGGESEGIQLRLHILSLDIAVAGKLHALESESRDLLQRTEEVLLSLFADGIELKCKIEFHSSAVLSDQSKYTGLPVLADS